MVKTVATEDDDDENKNTIDLTSAGTINDSGTTLIIGNTTPSIKINMKMDGELLERFEKIRKTTGIDANTEIIRHAITLTSHYYRQHNDMNPYFKT